MKYLAPVQDFLAAIEQAKKALEHSLGFFDSLVSWRCRRKVGRARNGGKDEFGKGEEEMWP
jgi:hypothetical protein